jgi:hypothetical protein
MLFFSELFIIQLIHFYLNVLIVPLTGLGGAYALTPSKERRKYTTFFWRGGAWQARGWRGEGSEGEGSEGDGRTGQDMIRQCMIRQGRR